LKYRGFHPEIAPGLLKLEARTPKSKVGGQPTKQRDRRYSGEAVAEHTTFSFSRAEEERKASKVPRSVLRGKRSQPQAE